MLRFPVVYFQWCIFVLLRSLKRKDLILRPSRNIDQSPNIARVKIFIYARPCVNKMTCSAVFFVPFPKYPKIDGNDKKLSGLFWEFSFVLATQSNSKSGEDVSQIIKPEWFVEKSAVKTDIYLEKDHKLVCVGKYPIYINCSPFLTFVLYPTKQVNYKVSSTTKNDTLLLSSN